VLGALSGQAAGGARVTMIAIGAVLTGIAVGMPLWQQRKANQARADAVAAAQAARAAMRITLEDALDPFVHVLGSLTTAKSADKARLRGAAVQLTVATIAALAGAERVRVCFFELESGRSRRLRPERFAGRAGAPTVVLTEGEPAGDAALRMIDRRAWTFIDDTRREPLPFSWDGNPEYRTVLLGPVATPDQLIGMLTLDALHPGELAGADPTLVRLLADLLATALHM
jgi:GAF domain-containing protein